jgi:hypothetical protein
LQIFAPKMRSTFEQRWPRKIRAVNFKFWKKNNELILGFLMKCNEWGEKGRSCRGKNRRHVYSYRLCFLFFSFSLSLDGPARCLRASSTDSLHYSWRTGGGRTWRMDNWIIPLPERAHLRLLLHKTIETRLLGEKKIKQKHYSNSSRLFRFHKPVSCVVYNLTRYAREPLFTTGRGLPLPPDLSRVLLHLL